MAYFEKFTIKEVLISISSLLSKIANPTWFVKEERALSTITKVINEPTIELVKNANIDKIGFNDEMQNRYIRKFQYNKYIKSIIS